MCPTLLKTQCNKNEKDYGFKIIVCKKKKRGGGGGAKQLKQLVHAL